jgi:WD40 repeat protein
MNADHDTYQLGKCDRMAGAGAVQIGYRSGALTDPLGRFELTVRPDGGAQLDHRDVTGLRVWTARLEHAVWARLIDALDRAGFPAVEPAPIPPGAVTRELTVEPGGTLAFDWGDTAEPALGDVFRVLDALVRQVSGGAVRSTLDELPRVVHGSVRATELAEPDSVPSGAAAFGVVDGRPACVVARDRVRTFALAGTPLGDPIPGRAPSRAVALAAEGDLLATAGDDGTIRVRNARTGAVLHARTGHRGPVAAVAAIGAALLSAGGDGTIRTWSGETAVELADVACGLTSLRHARVGERELLCAGADDGAVRLWDAGGEPAGTLRGHSGWVNAVALGEHDGQGLVVSGGADRTVRVWDVADGRELRALTGHTDSVTGVALSAAGGRTLAGSCSLDGTVRTWDAATGEPLADWPAASGWLSAVDLVPTPGGPVAVTAGTDVRLWDALSGAPLGTLAAESTPTAVTSATVAGRWVVAAGYTDGALRVWSDGTLALTIPGTDGAITAVAFGPGGLVSGTDDGTVRLHDVGDGGELTVPTPHPAPVLSLTFAGDLLISGGADGGVRVWHAPSGRPQARLRGHTAGVTTVATGRVGVDLVIASAGYDRVVRTWDAATGRPRLAIHGHMYPVYALAFGDGMLASASYDGVVRVWDPATGAGIASLPGHDGPVRGMCFDESRVAVATEDGTVRLWHLPAGELVGVFKVPDTPLAVCFADGHPYVATEQGPASL